MDRKNETLKFLIVGDSGVGKTSLLMRYCEEKFHTEFLSTIGVDFKVKKIEIDSKQVTLNIWDTAGQERFRNITKTFYKGADGVILVYSVTDIKSFQHIASWMQQVKDNGSETANVIIVGAKGDLDKERQVSKKEGKEVSEKFGVPFVETSAKDNHNIAKVFEQLASDIINNKDRIESNKGNKLKKRNHRNERNRSCC